MSDHLVETRLTKLLPGQAEALEQALEDLSRSGGEEERDGLPLFLLPMAEAGFTSAQIKALAEKVPAGFPFDHREIYFDMRLGRWMRHIEPPTVSEILEEYLESAESPAEGYEFLKAKWEAFLKRHGLG
ncbi:MAG: hypothetical protein ABIW76_24700 [Fibrobacteria bacterium]